MDDDVDRCRAHREQMHKFLQRDIRNAKSHDFILGFKVWGRHDVSCPLKGRFCGVFLPDQLPDLYPDDCPSSDSCNCILTEFVMRGDESHEAAQFKVAHAQNVRLLPVITSEAVASAPIESTVEEPQTELFSFTEARILRKLLNVPSPFVWDPKGYWSDEAGYPSTELLARVLAVGWLREATPVEKFMKFLTVARMRVLCGELGLKRDGDKEILAHKLAEKAPERAGAVAEGKILVATTQVGVEQLALQSGYAHKEELRLGFEQRSGAYQKLLFYARNTPNIKIQVNANPWSNCEKLPQIVGVYSALDAPFLPPGDCPNTGFKPCACWNASVVETAAYEPAAYRPVDAVVDALPLEPYPKKPESWFSRLLRALGL